MSAARCTKAQLAEQLEASHVAYQQLRAQYESLQAELHGLRVVQLAAVNAAPVLRTVSPMREAMARAKALAITTGRCIDVR